MWRFTQFQQTGLILRHFALLAADNQRHLSLLKAAQGEHDAALDHYVRSRELRTPGRERDREDWAKQSAEQFETFMKGWGKG